MSSTALNDERIILSESEVEAITGYEQATKQLNVLHARGFVRAFINRGGKVVLERTHYKAVSQGQERNLPAPRKAANLTFLKQAS